MFERFLCIIISVGGIIVLYVLIWWIIQIVRELKDLNDRNKKSGQ